MADIRCDICEERPSMFLISNTETGDTTAMCLTCYARAGLEVAKVKLPPDEILAALGIATEPQEAANDAAEAQTKPRKRGKAKAAEPAPGPEAPEGVEETSTATPDGGDTGL